VTYLFCGFDGRVFLRGCQKLPWHYDIPIREPDVQILLGFLQKHAFTRTNKRVFKTLKNPFGFAKDVLCFSAPVKKVMTFSNGAKPRSQSQERFLQQIIRGVSHQQDDENPDWKMNPPGAFDAKNGFVSAAKHLLPDINGVRQNASVLHPSPI